MTDDLHKSLSTGGRFRRKVRKHVGETWKPGQRNEPNAELGIWCKHCNSVHPWRNRKTLKTQYERRGGIWYILWTCAKTGNVLKEEGLVRK